jgi:hypothetical protein
MGIKKPSAAAAAREAGCPLMQLHSGTLQVTA